MGRYAFVMMLDNRVRFGDYAEVMRFIQLELAGSAKFLDFADSESFGIIEAKVKAAQEWAHNEGITLDILELIPMQEVREMQDIACAL
jgi:hypothetical protein